MPSSARPSGEFNSQAPIPLLPAAAYLRTSTSHQRYSLVSQAAAISTYAKAHGMLIIKIFVDEGKSGLDVKGRGGLRDLLQVVQSGDAEFQTILVHDVSRWGRFQNIDEGAYYEHLCTLAGINVVYCQEPFQNDSSPLTGLFRSVKRAMASESSRELSAKIFAGQCHLVKLGYRQGGTAGYGLRRVLINRHHEVKATLHPGERKSLLTDRVILAPGPPDEISVVERIYRDFVERRLSESEIATVLTMEGRVTDLNRPWTRGTVHQVLTNEKYIGNNVYNRTSSKLRQRARCNSPDEWIRCDHAFREIVPTPLFMAARAIIQERSLRLSDAEMLSLLRKLLTRVGTLSGLLIDEQESMPSSSSYQSRFGGLLRAYELVGYKPERDYRFVAVNRALRAWRPTVVEDIANRLRSVGADVFHDKPTGMLTVNGEWTASVIIARCIHISPNCSRWRLRFEAQRITDLVIAVRMDRENAIAHDYYIFPKIDIGAWPRQLADENVPLIDSYRFETLKVLEDLAERALIKEAA
ncbi:MAG: recombinase family protein [Achromobacter sp.]|uniref:recombinase family protein n=1 Tax=Achromobacter sp. TaxID=134375 RepID=UPI003D0745DB